MKKVTFLLLCFLPLLSSGKSSSDPGLELSFRLFDLNSSYTVSISKAHFKERMLMVETKVPAGKEEGEYNYSFDVNMISDTAKAEDPLDIPVMMIEYDQVSGSFFLSQPEGISVVSDNDVITDAPSGLPKQETDPSRASRKKTARSMIIRRNR